MPVSAYVIRCEAAGQPALLARLRALPGLEIGTPTEQGIPVAAEAATTREAAALGDHLQAIPGVRSAILVYHHFEDVADDETAQPLTDRPN